MSNRDDNSQYLTDQSNDNDVSYVGDTTMDNDQIQTQAGGTYAESGEMTSFTDPGLTDDYLKERPGAYRTATTRGKTRLVAQARNVPAFGGQMLFGAGVLRGISFTFGAATTPVFLRDGGDANALPIAIVEPGTRTIIFPVPIQFRYGLYYDVAATTGVIGVVYTDEVQD